MAKTRKHRGGVCPCALGARSLRMRGGGSCSPLIRGGGSCSPLIRGGGSCSPLLRGGGSCSPLIRGGGADSGAYVKIGGGSCSTRPLNALYGGYRATKKNRKTLRKYKQGKSIGFTARASLKAKGLIPRSNGTYKVSAKYARK